MSTPTTITWILVLAMLPLQGTLAQDDGTRPTLEDAESIAVGGAPDVGVAEDGTGGHAATDCTPPPPEMVGWWTLDEGADDLFAYDHAGDHHGSFEGDPTPGPGMVAGAFAFGTSPDRVRVPHAPTLDPGAGDLSIDAWVRVADGVGTQTIALKMDSLRSELDPEEIDSGETTVSLEDLVPPGDVGNVDASAVPPVEQSVSESVPLTVDDAAHSEQGAALDTRTDGGDGARSQNAATAEQSGEAGSARDSQSSTAHSEADASDGVRTATAGSASQGLDAGVVAAWHDATAVHGADGGAPSSSQRIASDSAVSAVLDRGYHFLVRDGTLQFIMANGASRLYDSGYPVADGAFHHVAVTVDRDWGGLFYVDGVAVASFPAADQPGSIGNTADLLLGDAYFGGADAEWTLDEVELFHRVLEDHEVAALYDAGSAGKCKTECTLPVDHVFEDGGQDNFAAPTAPTSQRPALAAFMSGWPQRDFDQTGNDRHFGHSFENLPSNIIAGTLEVRMRPDTSSLAGNDVLSLQYNGVGMDWGRRIGTYTDGVPGLLAANWAGHAPHTFVLDLANLPNVGGPPTDLLPSLEANGYLDVRVQDDTRIDYVLLNLTTCNCTPPPPGMEAWWPLDETTGTVAHDLRYLHDGTHANGPTPAAGFVAGGLEFDGVDDRVVVPDHNGLDMDLSSLSIDAWVRPDTLAGERPIVDKLDVDAGGAHGYRFAVAAGTLAFSYSHAGGVNAVYCGGCGGLMSPGAWSLVAVTFDRAAGQIAFYVDGVQVQTQVAAAVPNSFGNGHDLLLGAGTDPSPVHFDGVLDEVELFDRVLSAAEVDDLYRIGELGKCKGPCPTPLAATVTAGVDDGFATGNTEDADPRPLFDTWMDNNCFSKDLRFDVPHVDDCFGHSFQGLPFGTYLHATLELHIRADNSLGSTDSLALVYRDGSAPTFEWSASIPSLVGNGWNGGTATVLLDLGNLPGNTNLLPALTNLGHLDVYVQDDTSVDDMTLRYVVCEGLCEDARDDDEDAGRDDDFATGDGPEPTTPRPAFAAWATTSLCTGLEFEFDADKNNECIAHTFTGLPAGKYLAATLEVHARHTGCCPDTDSIGLQYNDGNAPTFLWGRGIDEYLGTSWVGGNQVITFDLSALPDGNGGTTNLLPSLGYRQALDVWIGDDTAVDDMVLRYTLCAC